MFELLFRITDEQNYLMLLSECSFDQGGDISGFFDMNVNGYHHGHYHNYPLQPGEQGLESITSWFILFIYAYHELNHSGYVAISDVESPISWIEFKKNDDMVAINLIRADKPDGTLELRTKPFEQCEYNLWYIQYIKDGIQHDELVDRRNESVNLKKFRKELIRKASQYLEELQEINPKLMYNRNVAELELLVSNLIQN